MSISAFFNVVSRDYEAWLSFFSSFTSVWEIFLLLLTLGDSSVWPKIKLISLFTRLAIGVKFIVDRESFIFWQESVVGKSTGGLCSLFLVRDLDFDTLMWSFALRFSAERLAIFDSWMSLFKGDCSLLPVVSRLRVNREGKNRPFRFFNITVSVVK